MNDELKHYGILGMKWGVRRFQPYPKGGGHKGRYTGKKKPTIKQRVKVSKKRKLEKKYAKEDRKNEKLLADRKGETLSDSTKELIKKNKTKGMTDKEAKIEAFRYEKAKKIAIGAGAVVATSAIVYGAYKLHGHRVDKLIPKGTKMSHVSEDASQSVRDAFYAATGKIDKHKYTGLYAGTLTNPSVKTVKVLSDIKQASPNNARKILGSMAGQDKKFLDDFSKAMANHNMGPRYTSMINKAQRSVKQGKVDQNVYEVFNAMLVDHSEDMQPLTDKFYKQLSKAGYNAIKDVNDSKYSGYSTRNPIITFNAQGKIKVSDVRQLAEEEIKKSKNIAIADLVTKQVGSAAASGLVTNVAVESMNKYTVDTQAQQYMKDNPNTNKSYTQVRREFEEALK